MTRSASPDAREAFQARIEAVRERVDYAAVIAAAGVQLGRGRKPRGKCPFHGSKSDSFMLDVAKGWARCWGCDWKGDVIKFVADSYGLGFTDALKRLEAIVHPAVGAMREEFLERNADRPLIVFDIPLLFEKGGFEQVDAVLVVSASAEAQRARVLARPGMSEEKFEQILKLQVPDVEKRTRADFVIDTGTSLAETRHAVQRLVHKLIGRE